MKAKISEQFYDAIDYFYDINYHLAAQITRLGSPRLVSGWPATAGVSWDDKKNRVNFLFNKEFYKTLTPEEFYFVVAHESMHVLNGHIFAMKTVKDKMEREKKDAKEIKRWLRKFNIAADCVVNDTLVNLYGLPKVVSIDGGKKPVVLHYGKNTVGCDCEDLSVQDVMWLIDELPDDMTDEPDNHQWIDFFDESGNFKKEFVDAVRDFVEDISGSSELSQEDRNQLSELEESMKDCTDSYAKQAGHGIGKNRHVLVGSKASLQWEKLLFRKVQRGKFEDKWNRPNRKLAAFWPDCILPHTEPKEVEEIFIAIDCSGSIDLKALNLFTSLVKNTPKNFKIKAISFDTACEEYDITASTIRNGGGTYFNIIEDYILRKFKKYPKAIFVLTDGYGNLVNPKYPERWTWLVYGNADIDNMNCIGNMTRYDIFKLMR